MRPLSLLAPRSDQVLLVRKDNRLIAEICILNCHVLVRNILCSNILFLAVAVILPRNCDMANF
jgi:hypothetical protein